MRRSRNAARFACIGILTREEIMHEMRDFSVRYEAGS